MRVRNLAVGILFFGIVAAAAFAQDAGTQGDRPRRNREAGAAGARGGPGARMTPEQQVERLNKELTLTQDQQDKIKKLIADHQAKMREQMQARRTPENREKMTEVSKQLEEATKAGDKEKVAKLETQLAELRGEKERVAAREKLLKDVAATLTDEQKKKFEQIKDDVFPGGPISLEQQPRILKRAVDSLKLPKEKADKINALFEELKTKTQDSKDPAAAKAGAAELYKKVMAELTPEEQAKVKAFRPAAGPMGGRERGGNRRGNGSQEPKPDAPK